MATQWPVRALIGVSQQPEFFMSLRLISTPRRMIGTTLAFAALALGNAHAQSYVNVTVGGEFSPGVYGQVTFGNAPPPPVYNSRPVIIRPVVVQAPVVYMHVPEEHRHHWSHYCDRYDACGRPVQFVQVNVSNRWWDDRRDYGRDYRGEDRRNDRYDNHRDERYNGHDNGRHRGHDKRRGDD